MSKNNNLCNNNYQYLLKESIRQIRVALVKLTAPNTFSFSLFYSSLKYFSALDNKFQQVVTLIYEQRIKQSNFISIYNLVKHSKGMGNCHWSRFCWIEARFTLKEIL